MFPRLVGRGNARALVQLSRLPTARGLAIRHTSTTTTSASVPAIDKKDAKMFLQFQCTNADCEQQQQSDGRLVQKFISKLAYEEGVVLVRCKCDKLHLIADRLEWFEDGGTDIEKIARDKGLALSRTVSKSSNSVQLDLAKLAREKGIHLDIEH